MNKAWFLKYVMCFVKIANYKAAFYFLSFPLLLRTDKAPGMEYLSEQLNRAARFGVMLDIKRALQKGADIDGLASLLSTPINTAAYYGQLEIVRFFAEEKNANLEIKNLWIGQTPFRIAASQVKLNKKMLNTRAINHRSYIFIEFIIKVILLTSFQSCQKHCHLFSSISYIVV